LPLSAELEAERLRSNERISFRGCDTYGLGFLFSDESKADFAGTLPQMMDLIEKNPENANVIFPFIGGKELVTHPQQMHHRYAINFADMSLDQARQWPDLLNIVEAKVKPQRALLGGYSVADRRREFWWQYGTYTPALYRAIQNVDTVLAISQTTTYICFAFLPSRMVFSHKTIVLPALGGFAEFALLQSRIHEAWALLWGSSTEGDTPVYSPPDCLETFPFPPKWTIRGSLEIAGKTYYEFRAALMVKNNEGLTKTYNRFHDPADQSPDILELRDLHVAMDRAVLDVYGWNDLQPSLDFLLDSEDESYEDDVSSRDTRKTWRYRWIDKDRDQVLARLLDLNRTRAEEEAQSIPIPPTARTAVKRGRKSNKPASEINHNLFEFQESTE
jgi:hypothetical protein